MLALSPPPPPQQPQQPQQGQRQRSQQGQQQGWHQQRAERDARRVAAARADLQRSTFKGLWKLEIDNRRKVRYWLLALNGLPTPARLHKDSPCPCGGGGACPGRAHAFWECSVARAVWGALESKLPAAARPLRRENIWLLREPRGVNPIIWGVICMAAIDAMNTGRKSLTRSILTPPPAPSDPRQRTLPEVWGWGSQGGSGSGAPAVSAGAGGSGGASDGVPGGAGGAGPSTSAAAVPAAVAIATALARARLQALLKEFCLVAGSDRWGLPRNHPVIRWDHPTQRLVCVDLI